MTERDAPYENLLAAVRAGNTGEARRLVQEEGVDWQKEGQRALYLAAAGYNKELVSFFLKELAVPHVRASVWQAIRRQDDVSPDDVVDRMADNILSGHLAAAERQIDAAAAGYQPKVFSTPMLGLAMQYEADGLFRFLLESRPDMVAGHGPNLVRSLGKTRYIRPLVGAGAPAGFFAADLFMLCVQRGDTETVGFLLQHGVDPNWMPRTGVSVHALYFAAHIADPEKAKEMIDLLVRHGADIRAEKCRTVADMVFSGNKKVFDLVERAMPGSDLPLLAGLQKEAPFSFRSEGFLARRYPYVEKWHERGLISAFFNANNQDPAWLETLRSTDPAEDDGFLLKMAVMSPYAERLVPVLLTIFGERIDPNTQSDLPLTLAVLTEKHGVINTLKMMGADIYARRAEAFREAARIGNPNVTAMLDRAASDQATRAYWAFEEAFLLMYRTPLSRLRGDVGGESGLMLAARAGLFRDLVDKGTVRGLSPGDFLKEGKNGATLLSVLLARREQDLVFSGVVWGGNAAGPKEIWNVLSEREKEACRPHYLLLRQGFASTEGRNRLREKLPRRKLGPKPEGR